MNIVTLVERPRDPGKGYDVYVDGQLVGDVHQGYVTFDRKPRGSRIVTTRTRSLRWFSSTHAGAWRETRLEAIGQVLAQHFNTMPWEQRELARTARVVKESAS